MPQPRWKPPFPPNNSHPTRCMCINKHAGNGHTTAEKPGCGLLSPLSMASFLNPAVLGLVLGTTKSRSSTGLARDLQLRQEAKQQTPGSRQPRLAPKSAAGCSAAWDALRNCRHCTKSGFFTTSTVLIQLALPASALLPSTPRRSDSVPFTPCAAHGLFGSLLLARLAARGTETLLWPSPQLCYS